MHYSNLQNVRGNSIDVKLRRNLTRNYSEIRADIPVTPYNAMRLWGQVKDSDGNPIPYVLLKLIKSTNGGYAGVAHTTADCQGFYQFDLCVDDEGAEYKILASRSNTCPEYTMDGHGNCPPSKCDPCPACPNSTQFSITEDSYGE